MKLTIVNAISLSRLLNTVNLAKVKGQMKKIIDICMQIEPHMERYQKAYEKYIKDANGKTPEEVENLVSAKMFLEIANSEVDINVSLTKEDAEAIADNLFTITNSDNIERNAGDYMTVYKLVKEDKPIKI